MTRTQQAGLLGLASILVLYVLVRLFFR